MMPVVRFVFLLAVVTVFAVLCVAQQAHVIHLGLSVERLEDETTLLAGSNRELLCEISALGHPARVAREVRRLDSGMLDPVALSQASAEGRTLQR